jgi:hypothetical protein
VKKECFEAGRLSGRKVLRKEGGTGKKKGFEEGSKEGWGTNI